MYLSLLNGMLKSCIHFALSRWQQDFFPHQLLRYRKLLVVPKSEPRHDKTNKMSVRPAKTQISLGIRPAKTQISLGIRPVWSESSMYAYWVAKDPRFLHADSEDSGSDWADAQADLSLRWAHTHFVGFVMSRLIFFSSYNVTFISMMLSKGIKGIQYSSRGFSISDSSQWADLLAPCSPTQGSTQTSPVILWYSPCDPPAIPLCFYPK